MKRCLLILITIMMLSSFAAMAEPAATGEGEEYIVKLTDETVFHEELTPLFPEEGVYTTDDPEVIDELDAKGLVEYSEENISASLFVNYSDPNLCLLNEQYPMKTTRGTAALEGVTVNPEIKVAVIDTGVAKHPDLPTVIDGKNLYSGTTVTNRGYWHGTAVAGIIAAAKNEIGIDGIAAGVKIVPYQCYDDNGVDGGTISIISTAIRDAVDSGCKVINLSLGFNIPSATLESAINYAEEKGVIVVASAGNDGNASMKYPAGYPTVVSVGALDAKNQVASFSQRNGSVLVTAPGFQVPSTDSFFKNSRYYGYFSGTSFSAPFIAGLAALCLSQKPDLKPFEFRKLLAESARDYGKSGKDNDFGNGMVDCVSALAYLNKAAPYYLSPIGKNDKQTNFRVFNNSLEMIHAESVIATYNQEGKLLKIFRRDLTLEGNQSIYFSLELGEYAKYKHFLVNSVYRLSPICNPQQD